MQKIVEIGKFDFNIEKILEESVKRHDGRPTSEELDRVSFVKENDNEL